MCKPERFSTIPQLKLIISWDKKGLSRLCNKTPFSMLRESRETPRVVRGRLSWCWVGYNTIHCLGEGFRICIHRFWVNFENRIGQLFPFVIEGYIAVFSLRYQDFGITKQVDGSGGMNLVESVMVLAR